MKFVICLMILVVVLSVEADYQKCPRKPPKDKGCVCPMIYDPVCSTKGCHYGNDCLMRCAGAQAYHKGECKSQKFCRD